MKNKTLNKRKSVLSQIRKAHSIHVDYNDNVRIIYSNLVEGKDDIDVMYIEHTDDEGTTEIIIYASDLDSATVIDGNFHIKDSKGDNIVFSLFDKPPKKEIKVDW